MDSFFSKLTRSVLGVGIESAYSASSFAGHLSDTTSPPYPDRPIHPLPKRRLRSRVSPETADSILYTGTSTPSKPLFSVPLDKPIASVSGSSRDPTSDRLPSSDLQEQPFGQEKHGYQFRGGDPDSDGEDADVLMQRCRAQRNRSYLYSNHNELRGGMTRASNVSIPMSAPSSQDSVDGYDSFENTNNKKKRKIPISGSSAGHHSSLSAEMASMGISTNRDSEFSQTEMDGGVGQYYGSGNFAVPAASSGNGISGAGRGRYARGTTRAPSGRGPLAVSTNGSNALQAGRQLFHKQDFTSTTQSSGKGDSCLFRLRKSD